MEPYETDDSELPDLNGAQSWEERMGEEEAFGQSIFGEAAADFVDMAADLAVGTQLSAANVVADCSVREAAGVSQPASRRLTSYNAPRPVGAGHDAGGGDGRPVGGGRGAGSGRTSRDAGRGASGLGRLKGRGGAVADIPGSAANKAFPGAASSPADYADDLTCDKADCNSANSQIFRELCVEEIRAGNAQNGSTSCVPRDNMSEEEEAAEDDDAPEEDDGSAMSTNQHKRGTNTSKYTSPMKKVKSPMVRIMKDIRDAMQVNSAKVQGELRRASIKECLRLTIQCGAPEGSTEYFMATQLFVKVENRDIFQMMETTAGRLSWLKMWCTQQGYYE